MTTSPLPSPEAETRTSPGGGHRTPSGGFTLIELIMVLLILGIVAGIVVLAVAPFRDLAEAQRDVTERAQAGLDCDPEEGPPAPGCDPTDLSVALPSPPAAGTLDLQVSPLIATTGTTVALTVTVLDDEGEAFDAEVLLEVSGANPTQLDQRTGATGTATFEYTGSVSGLDEATVCTGSNGRLPGSCEAAGGPNHQGLVAWMDPPILVSATQTHDEDAGDHVVVRWDDVVGSAGNVVGYELHDSSECGAGPSTTGAGRTEFEGGLLRIAFDEQWDADEPRWLRVTEGTEQNPFGTANLDTNCIEVGTAPDPNEPTIDSVVRSHVDGDGSEVVIAWDDAVRPGPSSDVDGYQLFDGEAVCFDVDGLPTELGEVRTPFDGAQLRIAFDEQWDAEEPRWLRVTEGTEQNPFGTANLDTNCIEVGTAPDPNEPTIDGVIQAHPLASGSQVLVTWDVAIQPLAGAGAEHYRLFDGAGACEAGEDSGAIAVGTDRTQLAGDLLRITLDAGWDAAELRWLRVRADAEGTAFGTSNALTGCVEVRRP